MNYIGTIDGYILAHLGDLMLIVLNCNKSVLFLVVFYRKEAS